MNKLFVITVLIFWIMVSLSWADLQGDVNEDDRIGLPEALNALQVATGDRTAMSNSIETYDYKEYEFPNNAEYVMKETKFRDGLISEEYTFGKTTSETQNGKTIYTHSIKYTSGEYRLNAILADSKFVGISDEWIEYSTENSTPSITYYLPPYVFGTDKMTVGDMFYNIYSNGENSIPIYREYKFIGFEDVTTPAGTFKDCMKLLRKRSDRPEGIGFKITYRAKNLGYVKGIVFDSRTRVTIEELVAANLGGTQYGEETSNCNGTWSNNNSETGTFSFLTYKNNLEFVGRLIIDSLGGTNMISQDGETYTYIDTGMYTGNIIVSDNGITGSASISGGELYNFSGICD